MKNNRIPTIAFWVIFVPLLICTVYFWVNAFSKGSYGSNPRAACLLQMRNVQQSVRTYAIVKNLDFGERVTIEELETFSGASFKDKTCPEGHPYQWIELVPEIGDLYLHCTNPEHRKFDHSDW